MAPVALYRCPKCGTEYRPLDAGARHFICCGAVLERVTAWKPHKPASSPAKVPRTADQPSDAAVEMDVIEIVPPRENTVDELAVETMIGSLAAEIPFSLEIAGDANGRRFLLRAPQVIATRIRQQVQAVYDQALFRPLKEDEDPARADGSPRALGTLKLRRPYYLPLLTFQDGDFKLADPMRGLLGAFSNLQPGERVLAQLILVPAPRGWADQFAGLTGRTGASSHGEPMTVGLLVRQFVSVIAVVGAVALSLWTFFAFMQRHWLEFIVAAPLTAAAMLGLGYVFKYMADRANINPEMVQLKIKSAAFDVSFRLIAVAPTPERANGLLRQLAMAYRQFDVASGNALVAERASFDPRMVDAEPARWWQELLGSVTRLNVAELAALWHLPVGVDVQQIERAQARRLLPLPHEVASGLLVGHAMHQGQRVPVHLDPESLWHHVFMVAKTQKGKSTLMAHLAREAMSGDTALVVIDPHGDLARSLIQLVPPKRAGDVVYIDFSDAQQVVGLNLLDMSQGRNADAIVSNIVHVGELIWSDYWGPRMEDALRMALRTLLAANEILARRNDKQFTLIDIPALFELENFRHRLIEQYVSDPEILQWWSGYFERLYESLRMDVINPVLTKIHRFSTHRVVRNIVGQSSSTVNFREILNQRRVLVVNTATGVIGPDAGGLLGAVLIDYINFAVREQMAIPDPKARARAVVVVDEFQSIPGVDYPGLLAELQKMGASFILATQALGQLKVISEDLHASIFSNIATLFVFQTSAEDADFLRHELDDAVTATDIINLADYTCYLKTQLKHDRLPVIHVQTLAPEAGQREVAEQILEQMNRYTRPVGVAESERRAFQSQWYGREMNLLRQLIAKDQKEKRPRGKKSRDGGETQEPPTPAEPPNQPRRPQPPKPTGKGADMNGVAGERPGIGHHAPHDHESARDDNQGEETNGSGQLPSTANP